MTYRATVGLGVGVCLLALPALAADEPSMSVFFTTANVEARKDVDSATKNALKQKRDEARKAREAFEKQLKQEFGKKRESWPPEKDDELYRLEEAAALANADYEYRKIDPKEVSDAVEDVARAAEGKGVFSGKKKCIMPAGSAEEAELVVAVVSRRSQKQFGAVVPSDCWLLFTLGPGGKLGAERFAKVPATYRARGAFLNAWKVAGPTPEKPVFTFESYNGGGTPVSCHGTAANSATKLVEKFIEDNYATLTRR
jgi:hypothetical protein